MKLEFISSNGGALAGASGAAGVAGAAGAAGVDGAAGAADWRIAFVSKDALPAEHEEFFKLVDFKGAGACTHHAARTTFVGIAERADYAQLTAAIGAAVRSLRGLDIRSIELDYHPLECEFYSVYAHFYGALAGLYSFDKYKSERKECKTLRIALRAPETADAREGARLAEVLAGAAEYVKDIVNEIPSTYTQESFAQDAERLAAEHALELKILRDKELAELGCEAFLAVNRASANPAVLAHLAYRPAGAKFRAVFVGKGLVYDTGGLSLKPGDYMLTMKSDKSGAAAALGIIRAVAELGLPVEVHAVLGCAQNCISERSYMPDDVLRSREGKTIEVRNTDAEGRLVLADALSYAQDLCPDLLIDLATLTGACVVGVGEFTSAVMGHSEALAQEFYEHSRASGEYATVLHFNPHLGELIKSKIADLSNTASSRYGGAVTAGMFLGEFIREEFRDKWLHLDIAGPAYVEKPWGENAHGAGAAGVRMCVVHLLKLLRKIEQNRATAANLCAAGVTGAAGSKTGDSAKKEA